MLSLIIGYGENTMLDLIICSVIWGTVVLTYFRYAGSVMSRLYCGTSCSGSSIKNTLECVVASSLITYEAGKLIRFENFLNSFISNLLRSFTDYFSKASYSTETTSISSDLMKYAENSFTRSSIDHCCMKLFWFKNTASPSQSKFEDSFSFSLFSLLFTDLIISYRI